MENDGWLVPVKQQLVRIESLDFSKCRVTAGELNGRDLDAVMREEENLQGIASATIKVIGTKRSVVFCKSVKQAERLSEIFNRHRTNSANWICGKTPDEIRKERLDAFASGDLQIMVNVGVLTEGWDCPGIEVVVMARPTLSRSLYSQMAGRSLRPLPGIVDDCDMPEDRKLAIAWSKKPSALILDFVGNSGRHKLVTTADILGGRISEEAKELAKKKIAEAGKAIDITQAMLEAEAKLHRKIEEAKRLNASQRASLIADAQYKLTYVDAFSAIRRNAEKWRGFRQYNRISKRQRELLLKDGKNPDAMSVRECGEYFRTKFGMTESQRRLLLRYGYTPEEIDGIKKWEASKLIEGLKKNNWQRPTADAQLVAN